MAYGLQYFLEHLLKRFVRYIRNGPFDCAHKIQINLYYQLLWVKLSALEGFFSELVTGNNILNCRGSQSGVLIFVILNGFVYEFRVTQADITQTLALKNFLTLEELVFE